MSVKLDEHVFCDPLHLLKRFRGRYLKSTLSLNGSKEKVIMHPNVVQGTHSCKDKGVFVKDSLKAMSDRLALLMFGC